MLTIVYRQDDGFSMTNGRRLSRDIFDFAALSSDEKPSGTFQSAVIANGSTLTEIDTGTVYSYDEQHACWCVQSGAAGPAWQIRVTSLTDTEFSGGALIDAVGIPAYISDVSEYAAYGITDAGWYVFARIKSRDGTPVASGTTVTGASGAVLTEGADHVDVAVRFEVAAQSKKVTIDWGTYSEAFVFRAPDLAIRNLDYRSTFYVYDLAPYATHKYKRSTDAAFVGTKYYTEDEGVYTQAAVKALEPIPADTYYIHSYAAATDETFRDGVTYYTLEDGVYTAAEVVVGDPVTSDDPGVLLPTYYVDQYTLTADVYFIGTAYYVCNDGEYEQVAVKAGETCSYYTKVITFLLPATEAFAGTQYWVQDDSELGYARTAVLAGAEMAADTYYTHTYTLLTAAGKFAANTRYYKLISGAYVLQTVTVGASYAKNTYYVDTWTRQEGAFVGTAYYLENNGDFEQVAVLAGEPIPAAYYTKIISYVLTEDETFLVGKAYYVEDGGEYVQAEVTVDGEVTADTYYEQIITYPQATGTFEDGVTYYTAPAGGYTEADVTVGETIPTVEYRIRQIDWPQYTEAGFANETYYTTTDKVTYTEVEVDAGDAVPEWYEHEKITFEGMPRNVTYRYNAFIDCPVEIVLPIVEDDGYGAWYEMQLRHKAQYSTTLVPQDEGIKVATDTTPSQTKGINALMLQYASVGGAKVWRLINTHSNFAGS